MTIQRHIPGKGSTYHNLSTISVSGRKLTSTSVFNSLPERFKVKIRREKSGCWIWTAAVHTHVKHKQYAYGYYCPTGRPESNMPAHRFAYEFVFGPLLIDALDVDHICQNKLCVNPLHLRAITHQDNCRLRRKRQRVPGSQRWLAEQRKAAQK